jgi:hypothetical protein
MTEFVLVRIVFLHGEVMTWSGGSVNATPIAHGRNSFRTHEVLGSAGFTMVNFDAEAIFGSEMYFCMLRRPAGEGAAQNRWTISGTRTRRWCSHSSPLIGSSKHYRW